MELTTQQKQALETSLSQLVTAGAGTGKTGVLTQRYIRLLREGFLPPEILTITFTEKSAGEMLDRILSTLWSLALEEPRWHGILDLMHTARISTIHSFCGSLLREFWFDVGIDPSYEVADSDTTSLLIDAIVDETISELNSGGSSALRTLYLQAPLGRLRKWLVELLNRRELATPWAEKVLQKSGEELFHNLRSMFRQRCPHKKAPAGESFIREAEALKALAELYLEALQRYEREKRERNELDFTDLLLLARDLLRKREIREAVRSRTKRVLVDEFQDTDPVQWDIIRLLTTENGTIVEGKLFVVGDKKQSIYRFRGADVTVFESASEKIENKVNLSKNFRSVKGIVSFLNAFFEGVFPCGEELEAYECEHQPLQWHREGQEDAVEVIFVEGENESTDDYRVAEASIIAERIHQLLRSKKLRACDIAILLRSTTNSGIYLSALDERGIHYFILHGTDFYNQEEVRDLLSLTSFLARPSRDLALASLLRSPIVGISDSTLFLLSRTEGQNLYEKLMNFASEQSANQFDRERLEFIRGHIPLWLSLVDRVSHSELLMKIIEETGLDSALAYGKRSRQKLSNISYLLELIASLTEMSFRELSDTLEKHKVFGTREAPPEFIPEDAVQLLSIHSAKGLEFPIVFVPSGAFTGRHDSPVIETLNGEPVVGLSLRTGSVLKDIIKDEAKRKDEAELLRILYVAFTRARDRLFLTLPLNPPGGFPRPGKLIVDALENVDDSLFRRVELTPSPPPPRTRRTPEEIEKFYAELSPTHQETEDYKRSRPLEPPGWLLELTVYDLLLFVQDRERFLSRATAEKEPPLFPDSPLLRGEIVHRAFQLFRSDSDPVELTTAVLNEYPSAPDQLKVHLQKDLPRRLENFRRKYPRLLDSLREVPFVLKSQLPGGTIVLLRGRVDLFHEEQCIVVDFKTESRSESELYGEYELQLELYALAFLKLLRETSAVNCALYLVPEDRFGEPLHFTRSSIPAIEKKLSSLLKELSAQSLPAGYL